MITYIKLGTMITIEIKVESFFTEYKWTKKFRYSRERWEALLESVIAVPTIQTFMRRLRSRKQGRGWLISVLGRNFGYF